ncbi:N-acetyltransferase [Companilactobacillus allii]|uniref:GNAT family N-acetyltransferase n=1 Tax=Companilactobacillus allii TaxID=1847728 RepID=A0A1P8PZQ3_9LACO|nr:GNAT family N-acetyltransferase [Companilactobacillus allii]APX71108.1 GNAT family N-acetyltransferase [Companilactobacillus allii]USQ68185.1 N-acetyltransferase [Companilactobacillus allii]
MEIKHVDGRFYIEDSELIGEITYSPVKEGIISIDHTFVNEKYRGQGIAGRLLDEVLTYADRENLKIVPVCSYAKLVFKNKPSIRYLLTENYRKLLQEDN